jgi:deazaflavin-dependent oxidoreductase (nitroreductase family)
LSQAFGLATVLGYHRRAAELNRWAAECQPPSEYTSVTTRIGVLVETYMPNEWNKTIIEEFRANGGKVGGQFAGKPVLLLHTTGAKSQQQRVNPVAYIRDGDRLVVIASKGGAPTNPDWYFNVVANPMVTVEVGTEQFQVHATISAEPERTRLYDQMVTVMPGFAEYRRKTTRIIPVIVLTRAQ